jgi:hypothetical protein
MPRIGWRHCRHGQKSQLHHVQGWTITKESVDALIPVLQDKLSELDPSVPMVLWCLDSACFCALTADSDLKSISKSATDGKYHVTGELMVTPFSLLNNTLKEIDRIISVCKEHKVWVMEIVPRFLLKIAVRRNCTA